MPTNAQVTALSQQLNFAGLEQQYGLPTGVLTNLVYQESKGNPKVTGPMTRYGQAKGLCQLLEGTARDMGCTDPYDPAQAIKAGAKYLGLLMDRYGGDSTKAIAAYNYGPGNLNKVISKYGADWKNHLPAETKNYIAVVGGGIGRSYEQRVEAGETIPQADRDAETARRRREAAELGMPDFGGDVLSKLFLALLAPFLDKLFQKMGVNGPATPENVQTVPTGTNVTPPPLPPQVAANRAPANGRNA